MYSHEVVRNTGVLYSVLEGRDDTRLFNKAKDVKDAGFCLEGAEVASMSVFVLVATPSICAFLWILLFLFNKRYNPESDLDNESPQARHGMRLHTFRAVQLFRELDEALSGDKYKWSGRDTETPYIRDLDHESVKTEQASESTHRKSRYIEPKLVRITTPDPTTTTTTTTGYREWRLRERVWNTVKGWFGRGPPDTEQRFELKMTREWDSKAKTTWGAIPRYPPPTQSGGNVTATWGGIPRYAPPTQSGGNMF